MPHHRITIRRTTLQAAALLVLVLAATGLATDADPVYAGGAGMCHTNEATKAITTGAGLVAEIRGSCYTPTVLHVEPGTNVTWTNRDNLPHTVTGLFGSWGDATAFGVGQSISFKFDVPGTFPYFCALHPMMQGVVVSGDGRATSTQPIAASAAPIAERQDTAALTVTRTESPPNVMLWALGGAVAGVAATSGAAAVVRRRQHR